MAFKAARPVGKFNPRAEMVVITPFWHMRPGFPVPKASYSRKRLWWRRGYIASVEDLRASKLKGMTEILKIYENHQEERTEAIAEPEGDQAGEAPLEEDGEGTVETVTALSAEEGEKGWWRVLFDDGTEKNVRRSEVEALGLLEE